MAIGPAQLREVNDGRDRKQLAALEEEIDLGLKAHFRGERITVVGVSGFPRPNVMQELVRRYRDAGWTRVEFVEDQRDGAAVRFVVEPAEVR